MTGVFYYNPMQQQRCNAIATYNNHPKHIGKEKLSLKDEV
jgi:hypothetical protein